MFLETSIEIKIFSAILKYSTSNKEEMSIVESWLSSKNISISFVLLDKLIDVSWFLYKCIDIRFILFDKSMDVRPMSIANRPTKAIFLDKSIEEIWLVFPESCQGLDSSSVARLVLFETSIAVKLLPSNA